MLLLQRSSYGQLPKEPGVYLFLNETNEVIYVGKAKDLRSRVSSYFQQPEILEEKTKVLVSQIINIKAIVVESELESLLLEVHFIKKFRPKYNIRMTDDKMYPLIRITVKEKYPAILYARKSDDPNSIYFGPFPSAGSVKSVLRTIRRIFPFHSTQSHSKKLCLYNHLGLCPCLPANENDTTHKEYRKNIKQIIKFLEGETKSVVKDLEKERDSESKAENFELASSIQTKIEALTYITQPFHKAFEYDINPNLRSDIRLKELNELGLALKNIGLSTNFLKRIECYDISNIQGTNSTASLVVLTNGEIDKNQYRKFKIKLDGTPNDFAMMKEALKRRLKHIEWELPELFIIDGGKGQVGAVLEVFKEEGIDIPLIGLAKREETIIIPTSQKNYNFDKITSSQQTSNTTNHTKLYGTNQENFTELSLPKFSPALILITRIRNEAHRFAITYHKKLRSKSTFN